MPLFLLREKVGENLKERKMTDFIILDKKLVKKSTYINSLHSSNKKYKKEKIVYKKLKNNEIENLIIIISLFCRS